MCDLIGTSISTLLGAFFGALFAYWFARHQRQQEDAARRRELLKLLKQDLASIGGKLPPYEVGKAIYRDAIRLNAPARLLDGNTLLYASDPALIKSLLNLNVALSSYNGFVEMANYAQATCAVPDHIHEQWYSVISTHNDRIVAVKGELIEHVKNV